MQKLPDTKSLKQLMESLRFRVICHTALQLICTLLSGSMKHARIKTRMWWGWNKKVSEVKGLGTFEQA